MTTDHWHGADATQAIRCRDADPHDQTLIAGTDAAE